MEWLLTVLIVTTLENSSIPHITIEQLPGIQKFETCLTVGLYTRTAVLQSDFRLPGESFSLFGEPKRREVIINCQAVMPV